ncbi:MAG: hypothetical protein HQ567_12855 [Candidatus Nealsonbacteria bacterium]|nr:hypothetical protein [Candidatus Nealsonbacteria bacterium]
MTRAFVCGSSQTRMVSSDFRGWHGHFAAAGFAIEYAQSANVSVLRSNERIAGSAASCDNTLMSKRRFYDDELHAQFVTFSCCYRRRRLLDHADSRQIVVSQLATELAIPVVLQLTANATLIHAKHHISLGGVNLTYGDR